MVRTALSRVKAVDPLSLGFYLSNPHRHFQQNVMLYIELLFIEGVEWGTTHEVWDTTPLYVLTVDTFNHL